ncbi:Vesicular glutamate transporter 3 [Nymphon striatum]|nr:Vesicular glutamate transporter 3 [Nymphon striatum]
MDTQTVSQNVTHCTSAFWESMPNVTPKRIVGNTFWTFIWKLYIGGIQCILGKHDKCDIQGNSGKYILDLHLETLDGGNQSDILLHVQASLSIPRRNSFEDHSEHSPVRKNFQVRYLMAALLFLGLSNAYGMKITLSVAIVQMVQETYTVEKNGTTEEYPVFDWNTLEQGRLLSSFFWGYIITQLPGGVLSGQFGGKKIFGFGVLLSTIFTLLTPLAATYGGLNWLMFVRIMIGMGEGVTYPAIVQFWSKWAPEMERTQLLALSLSGASGGTVVAMPLSGLLAQYFGWESVFYVYGGFGCMWFLIWHFTAAETPELHPFISIEEQRYIERTRTDGGNLINFKDIPWKKIATSLPFYAIIFGLGGCLTGGYIANFMDISSKYAAIIMGISNTIATIPGCISPLMAGLITSEHTLEEWRIVFYISSVVNAVGGTIFLLFASAYSGADGTLKKFHFTKSHECRNCFDKSRPNTTRKDFVPAFDMDVM